MSFFKNLIKTFKNKYKWHPDKEAIRMEQMHNYQKGIRIPSSLNFDPDSFSVAAILTDKSLEEIESYLKIPACTKQNKIFTPIEELTGKLTEFRNPNTGEILIFTEYTDIGMYMIELFALSGTGDYISKVLSYNGDYNGWKRAMDSHLRIGSLFKLGTVRSFKTIKFKLEKSVDLVSNAKEINEILNKNYTFSLTDEYFFEESQLLVIKSKFENFEESIRISENNLLEVVRNDIEKIFKLDNLTLDYRNYLEPCKILCTFNKM